MKSLKMSKEAVGKEKEEKDLVDGGDSISSKSFK